MSVGLLIVTHNRIGEEMLATARGILGICPLQTAFLAVSQEHDPNRLIEDGSALVAQLDQGSGVLILTDAFGSTPSNIAVHISNRNSATAVVSGVNLPMLLRVLNYPELELTRMQRKAISGGRDGVLLIQASEGVRQQGEG